MLFQQAQQRTKSLITAIHELPFNLELENGKLSKDIFNFYLQQDLLFLADYSKALIIIASRLTEHEHTEQLIQFSLNIIQAEKALHLNYMQHFGTTLDGIKPTPTCSIYTNFLLRTAHIASVEEAVASVMPCFSVYANVANKITSAMQQQENHPYISWINLYAGEEFNKSVISMSAIMNQLAANATPSIREKMLEIFIECTKFEWMFWDSAYKREQWPI